MATKKSEKSPIIQETEEKTLTSPVSDDLRGRAAWMYYVEQMTQTQIGAQLDISRIAVQRLLAESRKRREVTVSVKPTVSTLIALERELEVAYGLNLAIVAPVSSADADPVPAISSATGTFVTESAADGMTIGVGWGRTLYNALDYIRGRQLQDFEVISLLGGIINARRFNPAEFAWQLAEKFQGEGFLLPAPAIVDSRATRDALVNLCGLDDIFQRATALDAVLLSIGGADASSTAYSVGYLDVDQRQSLTESGAVGDLLFNFYNSDGELIEHEINQRVISVSLDTLCQVPLRILASGGRDKHEAMAGAMKLLDPNVLITDEHTAAAMLQALQA